MASITIVHEYYLHFKYILKVILLYIYLANIHNKRRLLVTEYVYSTLWYYSLLLQ